VVAAPRRRSAADPREAGNRVCPFQPAGIRVSDGEIDDRTTFDSSDLRSTLPRFTAAALKANQVLIVLLVRIAEWKNATPAQIALAWLLAQMPWIVPIPGTTKLDRLSENIGAIDVDLTADDSRQIEIAASKITVQGDRYPERLEQMTNR
jgi:aryl-alcohol dehydrogenase-like predicted oxidoreductase